MVRIYSKYFLINQPKHVTHAADNFDKLYEFAVQLIKAGKAYVCGEPKEMVNDKRAKGIDSAFRDTSVESNLRMFNNMKLGMYKEGEYVLRLKVNFKSIAFKIWQ